jgi:gluconate kinase
MREYRMTKKLAEELINQISRSKSTLIIEGLIDTEEERKEMREFLEKAGYQVSMIWVQTDLNTIKQRMRKKYRKLSEAKVALSKSLSKIEAPSEDEKTIVISGKHTPQTQCRNIINCLTDLQ